MSKKICFWCENLITVKGETLCPDCRKKYNDRKKELEQIEKEYNEFFGDMDCKEKIKLFKAKDQQISDLEAKLADTEFRYKNLHNLYYKDTEELKQQLAEKDAEIEKRQTTNDRLYKKNKKLENQIVESNIRFYKKGGIEKLEKVKHYAKHIQGGLIDYIDNQIEELKKECKNG